MGGLVALSWAARLEPRLEWRWLSDAREDKARLRDTDSTLFGEVTFAVQELVAAHPGAPGNAGRGRMRWTRAGLDHDPRCAFVLFVVRRDQHGLGGLLVAAVPGCPTEPPEAVYDLAEQRLAQAPGGW
jgi:hypothetical protein